MKKLNETNVIGVPPSNPSATTHDCPYTDAQMKIIEKQVKAVLNKQELAQFENYTDEEKKEYLLGFAGNVAEWCQAKQQANSPQQKNSNGGIGGMQPPQDGLDHWQPVKMSNDKSQQQADPNNPNNVFPDAEEQIEQAQQAAAEAEQNASQNAQDQSNKSAQDIANSAADIAASAQKMADAAKEAANAAQQAANQADANASASGKSSDVEAADKAQQAADAAQNMADRAQAAADKAKQAADDAQQAADANDKQGAASATEDAYNAAKEASNNTRGSQLNAKDAIRYGKETAGEQSGAGQNQDINKMSADQAAQSAQQAANQAQQAANQAQAAADAAQQKANSTGNAADQDAADKAQDMADAAAEAAQQAADAAAEARSAAESGNTSGAQQSAKSAQAAANQAQQQAGQAQQQAGQKSQQSNMSDPGTDPVLEKFDDSFDQDGDMDHDSPISTDLPFDGNDFFGNDDEMRQKCREMAERAGQPLDSDDYQSPQEYSNKKYQEAFRELKKWAEHHSPGTAGNSPMYTEEVLKKLFATKIDWRSMLEEFLTDNTEHTKIDVWAKRRMGVDPDHPFYKGRYLHPNTDYKEKRSGLAQVFFLVDASGSMGVSCGDGRNIFEHIMSELILIETTVKIRRSAFATFNCGPIYEDDIITWTLEDAEEEDELMDMLKLPASGGGTSAVEGIKSIQQYDEIYSVGNPWTLLVVVTDGGDYYNGLKEICKDPDQIEHMIWLITAIDHNNYFEKKTKELMEQGIPENHIICVDIEREWGVTEDDIQNASKRR